MRLYGLLNNILDGGFINNRRYLSGMDFVAAPAN